MYQFTAKRFSFWTSTKVRIAEMSVTAWTSRERL